MNFGSRMLCTFLYLKKGEIKLKGIIPYQIESWKQLNCFCFRDSRY